MRSSRPVLRSLVVYYLMAAGPSLCFAAQPPRTLATVNGTVITEADVALFQVMRHIPLEMRDKTHEQVLQQLIERELMRGFLKMRGVKVKPVAIDAQVERIQSAIRAKGDDPAKILAGLGMTEETLRKEIQLPLAWQLYARLVIPQSRLRKYYRENKTRFDGTELRARQILIKVPTNAGESGWMEAERQLSVLRTGIKAGNVTFEEAAQKNSQAPTAKDGGDVGYFAFSGSMPQSFTSVAFDLEVGEISEPFRSRFGVHLIQITDKRPGQLSLEDVRSVVFQQLAQEMWSKIVTQQRASAKIERTQ